MAVALCNSTTFCCATVMMELLKQNRHVLCGSVSSSTFCCVIYRVNWGRRRPSPVVCIVLHMCKRHYLVSSLSACCILSVYVFIIPAVCLCVSVLLLPSLSLSLSLSVCLSDCFFEYSSATFHIVVVLVGCGSV